MIHLTSKTEKYIKDYREYLANIHKRIDVDCQHYAKLVKEFSETAKHDPLNMIEDWLYKEDTIEDRRPNVLNIADYVADFDSYDRLGCGGEDPQFSYETTEQESNAHVAYMLEARFIELKQDCEGFLAFILMEYPTKQSLGMLRPMADAPVYVKPSEEEVNKLIEDLDFILKSMTYSDILELYEKKSIAYVCPEELPY